jgi:alkylated DNA repair dioxygenase AlkB
MPTQIMLASPHLRRRGDMNRSQLPLFTLSALAPKGLQYWPEFISPAEEQDLIARICELELKPFQFGLYQGKRRVLSFGRSYDFSRQRLEAAPPAPSWMDAIILRIESLPEAERGRIAQVLITEYQPGTAIGWHRDKKQFGGIFGLSLGASCPFRLRRRVGSGWERFTLTVDPRSLYLMSGDVRSLWEHSIPPMSEPRYSITFRTLAE